MSVLYGPIEQAVKTWLAGTDVAALVQRSPGVYSIYLVMPLAAPVPAVTITLAGGGPQPRADLPECRYRLSFNCWGTTRDEASLIARTLMGALVDLADPGVVVGGVYLGGAEILNMSWLPDPDSDTPRYIVDALIATVT